MTSQPVLAGVWSPAPRCGRRGRPRTAGRRPFRSRPSRPGIENGRDERRDRGGRLSSACPGSRERRLRRRGGPSATDGFRRDVRVSHAFWPGIRAESRARLVAGGARRPALSCFPSPLPRDTPPRRKAPAPADATRCTWRDRSTRNGRLARIPIPLLTTGDRDRRSLRPRSTGTAQRPKRPRGEQDSGGDVLPTTGRQRGVYVVAAVERGGGPRVRRSAGDADQLCMRARSPSGHHPATRPVHRRLRGVSPLSTGLATDAASATTAA